MKNILKIELIENYLSKFANIGTKNINECIIFMLDCLDDSILQVESLPISGKDKKLIVISIILNIYVVVISKNLPIYLKPFDSLIKFIVIQLIVSKLIDFIVNKYNGGLWRKESNYVSKKNM